MRSSVPVLIGVVAVVAMSGCGTGAPSSTSTVTSGGPTASRDVNVSATFTKELGPAITYDEALVPVGSRAAVSATAAAGKTTVKLALRGLQPQRQYGAHAHAKPCGVKGEDAGPHFQNVVDPVQPSVDPKYANSQNEIWLDLLTDPTGAGSAETTVAWEFPAERRAQSVVVHAMGTSTEPGKAGTAGARAACVTVAF
jgi:superoxide dismutase, Cu-Zn family